jgi:pectate lyase
MDISIGLNSFLLIVIIFSSAVNAEPAAFPGALGFGSHATGGRNGPVYHVTNLDDNGKGSFRDAVSTSNRIVVFDTSGYIRLKTAVLVKSNITIAGQTAPGGGIGFRGGEISFANGSNIICRYIRVRPGSETESEKDDALSLYRAKNIIVDHCSFEYGPGTISMGSVMTGSQVLLPILHSRTVSLPIQPDSSSVLIVNQ